MIKNKKLEKGLIIFLTFCIFVAGLVLPNVWRVDAGSFSEKVVDSNGGFSEKNWNVTDLNSVSVTSNKVSFSVEENKTVAVIARTKAVDNSEYFSADDVLVFDSSFTFNASNLSGDFGFLFAVPNSMDGYGVKNSSAVIFSYANSNIQIRVSSFDTKNVETSKLSKQNLGENVGLNESIDIVVRGHIVNAHTEPKSKVEIIYGSTTIADVEVPSVFGYVGFGCPKGGSVGLDINKCKIYFQKYVNASTTSGGDVWSVADFDSNDYNLNEWYAEAFYGYFNSTGVSFKAGKMIFDSTGMASFSTKYQYSNFDYKFTISDLMNNPKHTVTHEGEYDWTQSALTQYEKLVSCGFYVSLGALEYSGNGISTPYLYIQPFYGEDYTAKNSSDDFMRKPDCTRLVFNDGKQNHYYKLEKNLWDDDVATITFEVKQIDGILSFAYATDKGDIETINDLVLQVTPYGYVKLITKGHPSYTGANLDRYGLSQRCKQASFSLDNVKIKNLDVAAEENMITVGYQTSTYIRKDYKYQDGWNPNDLLGK